MLDAGRSPKTDLLEGSEVFQSLKSNFPVVLHRMYHWLGAVRHSPWSFTSAAESQNVFDTPLVVLGFNDKERVLQVLDQVTSRKAHLCTSQVLFASVQGNICLLTNQFNQIVDTVHHLGSSCKRVHVLHHKQPTIRKRKHLLVDRSVVNIVRPQVCGYSTCRNPSQDHFVCRVKVKFLVDDSKVLFHVVGASEVQFPVLVWDRRVSKALVLTSVTVDNKELSPVPEDRVFDRVLREKSHAVHLLLGFGILGTAEAREATLVTGLQGIGESGACTQTSAIKIEHEFVLVCSDSLVIVKPCLRTIEAARASRLDRVLVKCINTVQRGGKQQQQNQDVFHFFYFGGYLTLLTIKENILFCLHSSKQKHQQHLSRTDYKMFNQEYLADTNSFIKTSSQFNTARTFSPALSHHSRTTIKLLKPSQYPVLAKTLRLRASSWAQAANDLDQKQQRQYNQYQSQKKPKEKIRTIIQLPSNYSQLQGFLPFVNVNLDSRQNMLKVMRNLEQQDAESTPISVSPPKRRHSMVNIIKAEVGFNRKQVERIGQACQQQFANTVLGFKLLHDRTLKQEGAQTSRIKKRSTLQRPKQPKSDVITLSLNQDLYTSNQIIAKPAVSQDSWVAFDQAKQNVYFLGGRSNLPDIPTYSMAKNTWGVQHKLPSFVDLAYPNFVFHPNGGLLVIGGEIPIPNAKTKTLSNKVYQLELDTLQMSKMPVTNPDVLCGRRCQGMCLASDCVIIFGGIDRTYRHLNDLKLLDTRKWKWTAVDYDCPQVPVLHYLKKGIAKFTMAACPELYAVRFHLDQQMTKEDEQIFRKQLIAAGKQQKVSQQLVYVFGGLNEEGVALQKLLIIEFPFSESYPSITEPKTFGTGPSARYEHSMCLFKDFLIIHGGRNDEKRSSSTFILNDVYALNRTTMCWSLVKVDQKVSRSGHVIFGGKDNNSIWIFGGRDTFGTTKSVIQYHITASTPRQKSYNS